MTGNKPRRNILIGTESNEKWRRLKGKCDAIRNYIEEAKVV